VENPAFRELNIGRYISARYRMEENLGGGGMASVYRVFDDVTSRYVALKLLKKEASESPHLSALFEREFYTLVHLAHPRIIEVYDFGVDSQGAYYTMELLDGQDLRSLAPLNWKNACKLLRDVASSLALIHSRRLVHRDISSRNVRCTREGRAKLIDFGAMVPFGNPAKVIGTPPFIAPEALNHQPLDQRTDLYSLGALAYWLISKQHAYRAHTIAQLPDAWRTQPLPLWLITPEVPKPLNDLIMSLLSLDRMARPCFASELVEKLGAMAGLEPDDAPEVQQAYLTTPQLVGRGPLIKELRKRMITLLGGHTGETLLFEGPSGIGRSRLLAELVLEGKVIGATVLTADADVSSREEYGLVWELLEQLFDHAHDLAAEIVEPHVDVLNAVFPGLSRLMGPRDQRRIDGVPSEYDGSHADRGSTLDRAIVRQSMRVSMRSVSQPNRDRTRIQKSLLDTFLKISRRHRYVIAVDDIERVDEPSLALLSALALNSQDHAVVLAVTAGTGEPTSAACAVLSKVARHFQLGALDRKATEALLRSIFGETANLVLVADRIDGVCKGNPRGILQLAQHLLDRGVVKYQAGAWKLPDHLAVEDLPSNLTETLKTKLAELSPGALTLARTVALSGSNACFSFDECLRLADQSTALGVIEQLQQLTATEVFRTDGTYYGISQHAWSVALNDGAEDTTYRVYHQRLAEVFIKRDGEEFLAAQHFFGAGQSERAVTLLIDHVRNVSRQFADSHLAFSEYMQLQPRGWLETCNRGLAICEQTNRPLRDLFYLRSILVKTRLPDGRETIGHISHLIRQLRRDSGLEAYDELDSGLDEVTRLSRALRLTQERYEAASEHERVLPVADAIPRLAQTIIDSLAIAAYAFDGELLQLMPSVRPFLPLSPALGLVELFLDATRALLAGRFEHAIQLFQRMVELLGRVEDPAVTDSYRKYTHINLTYAIGLMEASIGIPSCLTRADEIEPEPVMQLNAWHVRLIYYLRQGDTQQINHCRKQLELLRIQNSPWQFYEGTHYYPELTAYVSHDDLSGVVQLLDELEKMAACHHGWLPILHYARGERERLRGDLVAALKEFESVLSSVSPGRHSIWNYAAGAHLRTLIALDRLQEARKLGLERLAILQKLDTGYGCAMVEMPLAHAEARLDDHENAERHADSAIGRWKALGAKGAYLGFAYETRARVAIYGDDPKTFRTYSKLCGDQYRVGDNPLLTAKHQKLVQEARQGYIGISREARQALELASSLAQSSDVLTAVQARLMGFGDEQKLLQAAIDLMVKRAGAIDGYLYLSKDGELTLAAKTTDEIEPADAVQTMRDTFHKYQAGGQELDITETQTESTIWRGHETGDRNSESYMLVAKCAGKDVLVGSVILCAKRICQHRPDHRFYEAVAQCIYDSSRQTCSHSEPPVKTRSRYAIETLLGEGGMASVYRAFDRDRGEFVAIKRARVQVENEFRGAKERAKALARNQKRNSALQFEYQTLKSLYHPRIIEVYDFGIDGDGAYYTMELLQGADLRQLAPLEWRKACLLLRDIASALAFVHSRRLLHLDVSPRNARLAADGRIKLMDFGSMAPIGVTQCSMGTPPFIPPEAVYRQPLDQRSDLYSLGALAYFLLTGRHAYPVRRPSELRDAWRTRPLPPSELIKSADASHLEDIPDSLDKLVISSINLDPLARPSNAAEVIEWLNAIGGLSADEQISVPQAYLTTPNLVGRGESLLTVRKCVLGTLRRRGGAILVEGVAGVGRSRFLDACVLEGKLAGLVVARAEPKDAVWRPYSAARVIVKQLISDLPDAILEEASAFRDELHTLIPELYTAYHRDKEGDYESVPPEATEGDLVATAAREARRPQVQTALVGLMKAIGRHASIMLAVDDVQRIDEPSAAFLALLSQEITDTALVLALTAEMGDRSLSSTYVHLVREKGICIELENLSFEDTEKLLSSVFGEVPNIRIVVDRLYKISGGNPRVIMRLAQYLLDHRLVRYEAGVWSLPSELADQELPATFPEALTASIRSL
jgi:serine/threonine protein kinase/predicted ATPase